MKGKLNIFFVSSEVSPFTYPGGLSDVSGALPKYLKNLGHEVRVMMPNYKVVNERKYVLRDVIRLQGLKIKVGEKIYEASAKSAFIPDSKVQIYFLDNKHFFDRPGVYFDLKTGKAFKDNAERYIFFSIGCLETLKLLFWQPDVIHCNDWSTAIIPTLLKTVYKDDEFFANTKTLLSIHNPAQQGTFDSSLFESGGLAELFADTTNSHVNFLKDGLENADFLNPIVDSTMFKLNGERELSNGISEVLDRRKDQVVAIGRGVDDQVWNPEKDSLIPFNYSRGDHVDKYKNKQELLNKVGLQYKENTPVLSTVTHFLEEKVNRLIVAVVDKLMEMDIQLIILGIGDETKYKDLIALRKKHPGKLALTFRFENSLAHLLFAGSDIYLMPYHLQALDLNHLYGLMYGTIPIVGEVGGTSSSIDDVASEGHSGTGFILNQTEPGDVVRTVKKAIQAYHDRDVWLRVMRNAMNKNLSWKSPAQQYVKLYQRLTSIKVSTSKQ